MSDIDQLAKAAMELGNHVAAAVRMSNVLTGVLKDGDRDDIDVQTRRVLLRAAKAEHDKFRSEHFRGLLDSLNAVVETADRLWQAEPATAPGPSEGPLLGDVTVQTEAPHGEPLPFA